MEVQLITDHYLENRSRLVKKMAWRTGSTAAGEDIVQTAYERALKYIDACENDDFPKWFSTIINNSFKDWLREESGYSHSDDDDEEVRDYDLHCPHYPTSLMKEVYELIDTKSEVQIEVLKLFFRNEYTAKDISSITEYSYSRCHQIIQRFRNELKDLYG